MKARLIVAGIGIPFLLVVLILLPDWATMVLTAALAAIAAHELLHAGGFAANRRVMVYTILAAAAVPVWCCFDGSLRTFAIGGAALLVLVFAEAILGYGGKNAVPFANIAAVFVAAVLIPAMLCCLLRLRMAENGKCLVFAPLAASFGSDTLALFSGMLFGRHKLAPKVSPKKTVEGALGGLLGGVLGMLILGLIAKFGCKMDVNLLLYGLYGLLGSVLGQLGDLSFSVIKREYGIKDYGKLLPGHGGVLDRFDSVIFVAPVMWLLLV